MLSIGPYRILETLGEGGMAIVYKAQRTSSSPPVAIKLMKESALSLSDLHARFLRESRILAKLNHPHIIRFLERGLHDNRPYMVTEFADSGDLRHYLNQGPLPLTRRLEIIVQVLNGLESAHQLGIIHRDLKPGNILLDSREGAKLTDFGIATALWSEQTRLTQTRDTLGTLDYIAPEQRASARHIDFRADHYAIGVILYELVTRRKPLGFFRPPSQVAPQIPDPLNRLILTCLNPDPAERFPSTSRLKAELVDILASLPPDLPQTGLADAPWEHREDDTLGSLDQILDKFERQSLNEKLSHKNHFIKTLQALATQLILEALAKTDGITKECLIEALMDRSDPDICPPMIALLEHPYYNEKAARVLAGQTCPKAEESLLKLLNSQSAYAHQAILPLGHLKSHKAIRPIAAFLKHRLPWVRARALDALSEIGEPSCRSHIESASLKDPDSENRARAQHILRRFNP
jgi:serine/threonine protein kinase